jgi:hypothetical protein
VEKAPHPLLDDRFPMRTLPPHAAVTGEVYPEFRGRPPETRRGLATR